MPIWYTSIVEEHLAVRNRAGIFDVSHMGRVVVDGPDASNLVDRLVPTNCSTQPIGKSFYTLLLNNDAGIIDDLIIIKRGAQDYLLVINAANKEKDLEHIIQHSSTFDVGIKDITEATTMIAVQGPESFDALQPLTRADLRSIKRFTHSLSNVGESKATITRTGYTGEDGFEVILYDSGVENNSSAMTVWSELAKRAKACALGARDSLRIEAGLPLYGSDIDETTDPIQAELLWVVSRDKRNYVGSESLAAKMQFTPGKVRRGIILDDKIPRRGFEVIDHEGGEKIGEITSGTFSPIIKKGVALAYLQLGHEQASSDGVRVLIRNTPTRAQITKTPFYDETKYGWKRTDSDKKSI